MTASKSDHSIFPKDLSLRIPALLIRISTLPHFSMVASTIAFTSSCFATLAPLAIASPPAASISCTTASAADNEPPEPSTVPPRSLTTTLAPLLANSRA